MIAAVCTHPNRKKHGKTATGCQRFRCKDCGETFTDKTATLDGMRIDLSRAEMIIRCMMEGTGVRAVARLTNTDMHTIMDLLVLIGGRCKRFIDGTFRDLQVKDVQVDELWSYVYCKERTRQKLSLPLATFGDQYCFVGMEQHTKLILAWHVGNREMSQCRLFLEKLARACWKVPFQLTADGWRSYQALVPNEFRRHRVNFAALIKLFGPAQETVRYSPAQITSVKQKRVCGNPDPERACTSHVERLNLSIRMGLRRFTRLTNAFSKKLENHEAALGLFFVYYNFCTKHSSIKTTPAIKAGLADHAWTVRELIEKTMGY